MAYFPNGTAGEVLDAQCCECKLPEGVPCPILVVQTIYNYQQLEENNGDLRGAMQCLVDDKGSCQMKPLIDDLTD